MIRPLLLLLLTLPAWADQATNFTALVIRDRAAMVTNPPPREPTDDERLLAEAVRLIDLAREALNPAYAPAKRAIFARDFLDKTDPVTRPVELGGAP